MRNILYTRMLSWLNVWSVVAFVPLENLSLNIWKRQHYRWRTAKCRPMLSTYGFSARREFDRATLEATRELSVCCPVLRTVLLPQAMYTEDLHVFSSRLTPIPGRRGYFMLKNVIYFCSGTTLITKNTILIKVIYLNLLFHWISEKNSYSKSGKKKNIVQFRMVLAFRI